MAQNILVATLGQSWAVVPEAMLLFDSRRLSSPRRPSLEPVRQVWVITTDGEKVVAAREKLCRWAELQRLKLRLWWPAGLDDIRNSQDNRHLADLIYRVVLHAHCVADGGNVYLSLAGGRKTMSAELQQAARVFGCRALIHVVDRFGPQEQRRAGELDPEDLAGPFPPWLENSVEPLILAENLSPLASLAMEKGITAERFALPESGPVPCSTTLYDRIVDHLNQADHVLVNLVTSLPRKETQGNFRALYLLPPERIRWLQTYRIGTDAQRLAAELDWLRQLPKAELHCHLGGILSAAEMIEVAEAVRHRVEQARRANGEFARDLERLQCWVDQQQQEPILAWLGEAPECWKQLRHRWRVPQPLGVAGFLLCFAEREEFLEQLVYRELLRPERFQGVGFTHYEALGDLQGSGLLQCEETLRGAFSVLERYCREENIRYLELRCSPLNYTRGGLSSEQVVNILVEQSRRIATCDVRLIFIASRHRDPEVIRRHVELVRRFQEQENGVFRDRFVGFDLAGDEGALPPQEVRRQFLPLMEEVVRITIHAGENAPAENIWQAVYHLSADRIGHGLSLHEHEPLMRRVVDRGIAVELCPSSNDQIVGFRHFGSIPDSPFGREYPLKFMLDQGVRVTLNTDNPGISRTGLSQEFYQAAVMTPGGLSPWQVLQLIRNGFRAAFCNFRTRQRLLREVEFEIVSSIINRKSERMLF